MIAVLGAVYLPRMKRSLKLGYTGFDGTHVEMLRHLSRQFAYDAWANAETLSAIKAASDQSTAVRPLKLLAHILSAEKLWLERLKQQPQTMPVWPESGIAQCEMQIGELSRSWRQFFAELSNSQLGEKVTYKNSKGEPWSSKVEDVLTHVLLHSAYHRGQIASALREAGATPPYTDFIHAVRQGFIE
jgi:uncharacterized damage-inducible protein DinB